MMKCVIIAALLLCLVGSVSAESGLVAYYSFDGNAQDSSGNGNDGTVYGASFTSGISEQALNFDGVDDYVELPSSSNFDLTSSLTLSAWIYPTGNSGNAGNWGGGIIAKGHPDDDSFGLIYDMFNDKHLMLALKDSSDGCTSSCPSGPRIESPSTYDYNQWYHVVGTYDGTTMRLYVDGNLVNSRSFSGSIALSNEPVTIGTSALSYSQPRNFKGIIDEVKIYSRVLSASEIQANYDAIVNPTTTTTTSTTTTTTSTTTTTTTTSTTTTTTSTTTTTTTTSTTTTTTSTTTTTTTTSTTTTTVLPPTTTTTTVPQNTTTTVPTTTPSTTTTTTVPTTTIVPTTTTVPITTTPPTATPVPTSTQSPRVKGSIIITSSPTGADVLFDDIPVGKTPATKRNLPIGIGHKIVVSKTGYFNEERVVSATSEGTQVYVKLEEIPTRDVPHITVSQTTVKTRVGVGEDTVLSSAIFNDGYADAYNVKLVMEVGSGLSTSFVSGADKAGGLAYWTKDVIKEGQAESATLRVTCNEEGQKSIPVKITYRDISKNKYTDDTSLSIICEALAEDTEEGIDSDGDGWNPTDPNIPKRGICGPTALLGIAILPLGLWAFSRRRR